MKAAFGVTKRADDDEGNVVEEELKSCGDDVQRD